MSLRKPVWLYLILCEGDLLYTGVTNNVDARYAKHARGAGSVYTQINRPRALIGMQPFRNRSEAMKAELDLKAEAHLSKLQWARRWPPDPTAVSVKTPQLCLEPLPQ